MALLNLIFSIGLYNTFLIFLTLIIVYTCRFYYKYFTRENPLPGPLPLPFVGNIIDRGFDEFVEYTERMQKKYGDIFEIYFGSQKFIMLSKYEYIQNMFDHSLNSKYMRRIPYISGLDELDVAGKGIALNHNVNVWKFNRHFISRALLTPVFLNIQ
ncbi:unnamed protein product [Rhizophagus irregularis]|nr:unnamed protein product [Rhizophagus irregularis]